MNMFNNANKILKNMKKEKETTKEEKSKKSGTYTTITCQAEGCSNTKEVKLSDIKRGYGRFCSKSCAKKGVKKAKDELENVLKKHYENNNNKEEAKNVSKVKETQKKSSAYTTITCQAEGCNNTKEVKLSDIKRGYGRFCSKSCGLRSRKK